MQRSRIKKRQPKLSTSQLAAWKNKISQNGPEQKEKKVRIFNQHSHSNKGRIRLDSETWINYDYGREFPVIKLHKKGKDEEEKKKKDEFTLRKYPTLHSIIEETTPKVDQDQLREMDLFIIKDLNQGLLWKNKNFEFH